MDEYGAISKVRQFLLRKKKFLLIGWVVLSFLDIACDYFVGPFIQFPIFYIFPVLFATWFNGPRWGLVFACLLPLTRVFFSLIWTSVPWSFLEVLINAVIRMIVFSLIVLLVDSEVKRRSLLREIKVLRGILPICSFCKKIRTENNTWIPIEQYVDEHSEAEFSHGFCPDCMKDHYGVEMSSKK
jgi:hypothetical protein